MQYECDIIYALCIFENYMTRIKLNLTFTNFEGKGIFIITQRRYHKSAFYYDHEYFFIICYLFLLQPHLNATRVNFHAALINLTTQIAFQVIIGVIKKSIAMTAQTNKIAVSTYIQK